MIKQGDVVTGADIQQAVGLFQSGQVAQAKVMLDHYISRFPDDVTANMLSAAISAMYADYESVLSACDIVLREQPENVSANYNAAVASEKLGRLDDCLRYVTAVLKSTPDNIAAQLLKINSLYAAGDHQAAISSASDLLFMRQPDEQVLSGLMKLFQGYDDLTGFLTILDARRQSGDTPQLTFYHAITNIETGILEGVEGEIDSLLLSDSTGSMHLRAKLRLLYAQNRFADCVVLGQSLPPQLIVSDMVLNRRLVDSCLRQNEMQIGMGLLQANIGAGVNVAESHHNLSILHERSGHYLAAIEACEACLALAPDSVNTLYNLAFLHDRSGDKEAALSTINKCVGLSKDVRYAEACIELLSNAGVESLSEADVAYIGGVINDERLDPQILSSLVMDILMQQHRDVAELCDHASSDFDSFYSIFQSVADELSRDVLLRDMYANLPVTRYDFELFTRKLRSSLLKYSTESTEMSAGLCSLCCAIGIRSYISGYVYVESEDDELMLADLVENIASADVMPSPQLMVVSMYRPLTDFITGADAISIIDDEVAYLPEMVKLQVMDRDVEDGLIDEIGELSHIEDETSLQVKQQYEGNPYPVWQRLTKREPTRLVDVIDKALSTELDLADMPDEPDVLIAGCGTGSHALQVAMRYRQSSLTAIDLSMRSLAFAMRKALEYGYDDIDFNIMDILQVASMGRVFDVIESVGVVHHMEDPQAGFNALSSVLRKGGLFNIGLYSKLGRRYVIKAKAIYDDPANVVSDEEIRNKRLEMIAAGGEISENITSYKDFFTLDDCRDLIFHENENNYDTLEIAMMLDIAGLEFIGFEHADKSVMPQYREMFPDDPHGLSLANWNRYEQRNPDTFAGMYMFWCRKR